MCYIEKHVHCFSNDTPKVKVAYSLACIIRSILFSEYYKCNGSPNTLYIIDKLRNEIAILKDIGSFYNNWINRSLSSADFLLLKMNVPKPPPLCIQLNRELLICYRIITLANLSTVTQSLMVISYS